MLVSRVWSGYALAMATPLSSYQKRLLLFLSVACFFEGYDFLALSQLLPTIRTQLGTGIAAFSADGLSSLWWAGVIVSVVNAGTVFAYFLVKKADVWGRKRVLTITIAGYTLLTFLTGLSPNIWWFMGFQFLARVFLIAEWATSMVIAAEELPADRRAFGIGLIQAATSLGSVACAALVPLLLKTPYGWRTVYFVGVLPLVLLAFSRRSIRETERFDEVAEMTQTRTDFFRIWRTPYRKTVLKLALCWTLAYIPSQTAINFWNEFATSERNMSPGDISLAITIGAVASMPMLFMVGWMIDRLGRRRSAVLVFVVGAIGIVAAYTMEGVPALALSLTLCVFGVSAYLPIFNAYTSELFPTQLRGDAFAWSNNILGRIAYVGAPLIVSLIAQSIGSWGPAVAATAIFNIAAAAVVYFMLPETSGMELEETARWT